MEKPDYLTFTALCQRPGWSATMIARFLPKPHANRQNPRFKSAAAVKLYERAVVELIESRADWQEASPVTTKRRAAAEKAVQTKYAKLLQYVEDLLIDVPMLDHDTLTRQACNHYNDRKLDRIIERGGWDEDSTHFEPATSESAPHFLARITTNYLRHKLTHYERELEKMAGNVGHWDGYERLKQRVNDAIWAVYPHIKHDD